MKRSLFVLILVTIALPSLLFAQDADKQIKDFLAGKWQKVTFMEKYYLQGSIKRADFQQTVDIAFEDIERGFLDACTQGYGETFAAIFQGSKLAPLFTKYGKDAKKIQAAPQDAEVEAAIAEIREKIAAGEARMKQGYAERRFLSNELVECVKLTHERWLAFREAGKGDIFKDRYTQSTLKSDFEYYGADVKNLFKTDREVFDGYLKGEYDQLAKSANYARNGQIDRDHVTGYAAPTTLQRIENRFGEARKAGQAETFVAAFEATKLRALLSEFGVRSDGIAILEHDADVELHVEAIRDLLAQAAAAERDGLSEEASKKRFVDPATSSMSAAWNELKGLGKERLFELRLAEEGIVGTLDWYGVDVKAALSVQAVAEEDPTYDGLFSN